jgi:hypothetical protein
MYRVKAGPVRFGGSWEKPRAGDFSYVDGALHRTLQKVEVS